MILRQEVTLVVVSLLFGPIFYFLAPQPISASTTLLILWRVPDDPRLDEAPHLAPYRAGDNARNYFAIGFVVSFVFVYVMPAILWMTSVLVF